MNKKRFCFTLLLTILIFTKAFAQEQTSDKSPVGKWAKNIGTSEYFLEIDDSVIKYINKKSEKYIRLPYHIEGSSIVITSYYNSDPLKFNEINEDLFYHLNKISHDIEFSRKKDNMSFFITNHKGKPDELKFTLLSHKEKTIGNLKTAGKVVGTVAAVGAALLTADAIDDASTKSEMQSIADDCLKASTQY